MNANSNVTRPSAKVNGWRRLWIVATISWCLFIVVDFGIYLAKASAHSKEAFSWGSWNQYNSAITEAEDPRCLEILQVGPERVRWYYDDPRKRICRNLRYQLMGIEMYPVTPEQAQDALVEKRNIHAFLIEPAILGLILFLPPAVIYLFGTALAWVRRGFL